MEFDVGQWEYLKSLIFFLLKERDEYGESDGTAGHGERATDGSDVG